MCLPCTARRSAIGACVAVAASVAAFAVAAPARAQHVEYKASITLTGAYTQSITDAPAPNAQTFAGPSISLSPAILALIDTPRTENTLGYAFTLSVPFLVQASPTANTYGVSYANRLTYAGHYALSEVTNLNLGASFTESPINTFVPSQDPTAAPIQSVASGSEYLLSAALSEGVTRQVSERNTFGQAASFLYGHPIDPTSIRAQTFSVTNSFSVGHIFPRDTVGVTLTDQLNYFTASQAAATDTEASQPVVQASSTWVNSLAANWDHAFTEAFSMRLVAGATQTLSPGAATFMQVQPTGSATLSYNFLLATAGLAYAHGAAPNVGTGTVNFTDAVSLRFGAPLGRSGLHTTGTVGYTHAVPIGTPVVVCPADMPACAASPTLTSPSDVYIADLGLDYHPWRVPTLTVGLRGQLSRQVITEDITNTFTRYTIALSLTYSYPNANAAASRPQLSPLFSATPAAGVARSDVVSLTDRFFTAPVAGPAPAGCRWGDREVPPNPRSTPLEEERRRARPVVRMDGWPRGS